MKVFKPSRWWSTVCNNQVRGRKMFRGFRGELDHQPEAPAPASSVTAKLGATGLRHQVTWWGFGD